MNNSKPTWIGLVCLFASLSAQAATIGGTIYSDRNRNGIQDAGEQPLVNVSVQLVGAEGSVSRTTTTAGDGGYSFAGLGDGDYIVAVPAAPRLRASLPNQSVETPPISNFPFGLPRYSGMANAVTNLSTFGQFGASYRHMGLGDSIGFGFSVCGSLFGDNGYFEPATDRFARATATVIEPDKQAIPGHETADLLIPGLGPDFPLLNNDVFDAIDLGTPLISISIGGNDFLGADSGGDPSVAAALVIARRNVQEILSTLQTQIPFADIEINTVYDNLEGADAFHNVWVPIWDQVLREAAWGQLRRVTIAEVYRDYAHDENNVIVGEPGLICNDIFGLDGIHPTVSGYDLHEEKLWQSFGGVTLAGGSDRLDVNLGFQRVVPVGQATTFTDVTGDTVNPGQAIGLDNSGALVPSNSAEFRVQGFLPNPPSGVEAQSATVKVRYRTTGAPLDDYYVIEASLDGTFSAPGSTPTTWNTIIPLVGSSGNDGAERLAFPDQPSFRIVSAPLYTGAPIDGSGAISMADLSTLSVRVVTTAVGAPDAYSVEFDGAFIEIFPVPASTTTPSASVGDPRLEELRALGSASLRNVAKDADAGLRRTAARLLAARGDPVSIEALREMAGDTDSYVRLIGTRALAARGGAEELLLIALNDDAPAVRVEAAAGLLAGGNAIGADELVRALGEPLLAKRARRGLAANTAGVPALLGALRAESAQIRTGAAWVLGSFENLADDIVPALRASLDDADPAVWLATADALSRLGDANSIGAIRDLAAEDRFAVNAARALGRYRHDEAYAGLFDIARSDAVTATARRFAARYLALGGPEVIPELTQLLDSDEELVRRLARSGLARFGR